MKPLKRMATGREDIERNEKQGCSSAARSEETEMTYPGLKTPAQYEHELVECRRRIDADTLYRAALAAQEEQ